MCLQKTNVVELMVSIVCNTSSGSFNSTTAEQVAFYSDLRASWIIEIARRRMSLASWISLLSASAEPGIGLRLLWSW